MRLFCVINQDLFDGSAHALYCFRHGWWLAQVAPDRAVELVYPGQQGTPEALVHFGFGTLPNFRVTGLPALRKAKHGWGPTLNLVYHWALFFYLRRRAQAGDWLLSPGFPKTFRFLCRWRSLRQWLRAVYEVHQLNVLDDGALTRRAQYELDVLGRADLFITSAEPAREILRKRWPEKPAHNLGLACGFSPDDFPPPRTRRKEEPFTVAYIGSVYHEQGVEWLIRVWSSVRAAQAVPVQLEIVGGAPVEAARLRQLTREGGAEGITIHGAIAPQNLPAFLGLVNALLIPSLPVGRMPYVAITKAYDYLGLRRPILAANLPSIAEILRPGQEALLFQAGEAQDLARVLHQLLDDPGGQARLVEAASVRAREYAWPNRARRWWEVAG